MRFRGIRSAWAGVAVAFALEIALGTASPGAFAQDYAREQRWADETVAALVVGDAVRIEQKNGHRFLGLYTAAANPRGAVVIAHGRGWAPDHDLYGALRVKLAEAGFSTLSIQMPVLDGMAKLGDYLPTFPDADERLALATQWLRAKGHAKVGIVSHSLGATMANHYLVVTPKPGVDAWVFIGIINGLEDMFRIRIPVLDVFGAEDWHVTRLGADERLAQIKRIAGSEQVIVPGAEHFFEGKRDELTRAIAGFLERAFRAAGPATTHSVVLIETPLAPSTEAAHVEDAITAPLEQAMAVLANVTVVRSTSTDGRSRVWVEFEGTPSAQAVRHVEAAVRVARARFKAQAGASSVSVLPRSMP